nr:GGDEF domain-containing protein [uncultured Blautia sp.]
MWGFIAQDKSTVDHYFIGNSRDITREKLQEEFPEERAQKDPLTGLSSFSRFRENVEKILIGGYGPGHAVLYTDFEKFKRINAKYGYRVGDQILRQFSEYVVSALESI